MAQNGVPKKKKFNRKLGSLFYCGVKMIEVLKV